MRVGEGHQAMTNDRPRIELVYDRDCPNVDRARGTIRAALEQVGSSATWVEWDRGDASTPAALRDYGSPTVLVNGRDVASGENEDTRADANSCRVYMDECGCMYGAPSATLIADAIRGARVA